jgi:hypothetical protein
VLAVPKLALVWCDNAYFPLEVEISTFVEQTVEQLESNLKLCNVDE